MDEVVSTRVCGHGLTPKRRQVISNNSCLPSKMEQRKELLATIMKITEYNNKLLDKIL